MKTTFQILLSCVFTLSAHAEFRMWTRTDGKISELDLTVVTENAGEKAGVFKMRNGQSVTLQASGLAEADAKLLNDWKPAASVAATAAITPSVFDKSLDGNLLKFSGKSLKTCNHLETLLKK